MSSYRLFVGIDVSATRCHGAWGRTADEVQQSLVISQTPAGIDRFIGQLLRVEADSGAILVVMEATGTYWMRLACALYEAGVCVSVINPAQAHHFSRAQLRQAKTDPIDAQMLMQLAITLQPALWTPPPATSAVWG